MKIILLTLLLTLNLSAKELQNSSCEVTKQDLSIFLLNLMKYSLEDSTDLFKNKLIGEQLKNYKASSEAFYKRTFHNIFSVNSLYNHYEIDIKLLPEACTAGIGFNVSLQKDINGATPKSNYFFKLRKINNNIYIYKLHIL